MKVSKMGANVNALNLVQTRVRACVKLPIDNIVFPQWSDIGLIGMMFRQSVKTKEQPAGNIYDETQFQTVLRILDGKVLMNDQPDCYCWKLSKLQTATDIRPIGVNSSEAIVNMCYLLNTITQDNEKLLLADMFASMRKDLLWVKTPAEQRSYVEVTQDLYDAGLTYCVDEWMEEDENGCAEETKLSVGDVLIITNYGMYCIRHDEFWETHQPI